MDMLARKFLSIMAHLAPKEFGVAVEVLEDRLIEDGHFHAVQRLDQDGIESWLNLEERAKLRALKQTPEEPKPKVEEPNPAAGIFGQYRTQKAQDTATVGTRGTLMTKKTSDTGSDLQLAIGLAIEYADLIARGDLAPTRGIRETIDTLVGRWIEGAGVRRVWGWPACVVAYARSQARTDLPGYVPASEVRR